MEDNVRTYFANMPWRGRVLSLALIVGLLCGVVAVLYEMVMDFTIELVWEGGYEVFIEQFPSAPPYLYIMLVCCTLGPMVGILITLLGEPMANLPGVVLAAHKDGLLGHGRRRDGRNFDRVHRRRRLARSGGATRPIGGGLASLVSIFVDLTEAETSS